MSDIDIACLCVQVNRVTVVSSQFTNLRKWGVIAPHPPCYAALAMGLLYHSV